MKISVCSNPGHAQLWERYVSAHPQATYCHRWPWKQVIEKSFGWETSYLLAEEAGAVCGVLPLVIQKSWLFGSFVSSMPFLNAGGILADSMQAYSLLLEEAT